MSDWNNRPKTRVLPHYEWKPGFPIIEPGYERSILILFRSHLITLAKILGILPGSSWGEDLITLPKLSNLINPKIRTTESCCRCCCCYCCGCCCCCHLRTSRRSHCHVTETFLHDVHIHNTDTRAAGSQTGAVRITNSSVIQARSWREIKSILFKYQHFQSADEDIR